jgi:hypothetical protein
MARREALARHLTKTRLARVAAGSIAMMVLSTAAIFAAAHHLAG